MRGLLLVVALLLAVYFALYVVGTLVSTLVAALVTRRRRHELLPSTLRRIARAEMTPGISVCVAAYNESAVIVDTMRSLLALDYPRLEVVVVNDGSTDATLELLRAEFDLRPSERAPLGELPHLPLRGVYEPRAPIPLVVVDKENGGRSDALNAAIVYARGPLVAVVDADEVVAHDTLARAIDPFLADPDRTVAAGASLGIANGCRVVRGRLVERRRPRTLLPLYQAVEYERAFRLSRVAASAFRAMPIISGGFGLFRRDLVLAAGGYETDTLGEDFDLTVRLHRFCRDAGLRYRIAQVPEVVCWTLVPNSPRVLRRQRRRWQRGLQQVLGKHRDLLFRPRYRGIGLVALPWAAAFELLNPLIVVLATLVTALCLVIGLMGWPTLVLGLFVTWVVVVAPTLGALLMTESPGGSSTGWRNLGATVGVALVDFPYQWLTLVYRLEAMLLPRRSSTWGEMERSLPGEP